MSLTPPLSAVTNVSTWGTHSFLHEDDMFVLVFILQFHLESASNVACCVWHVIFITWINTEDSVVYKAH
jgi:hypothetical protein